MRKLRKAVDVGLPIVGVIVVLSAVLLFYDMYTQIALVVIGVLLIEAGIWKLASPLLPSQRRHQALRAEVDTFVGLVRDLNTAALEREGARGPEAEAEFAAVRERMHASVERMAEYAGKAGKATSPAQPTVV
jgi:hypothetical protein